MSPNITLARFIVPTFSLEMKWKMSCFLQNKLQTSLKKYKELCQLKNIQWQNEFQTLKVGGNFHLKSMTYINYGNWVFEIKLKTPTKYF